MEKLSQLLKTEREKRGLSLHEIGMSLKINPKILKAIEENDTVNLPAKTFLRGFVRSYAQYLRLDVEQALKLFQAEYGTTRPEETKSADSSSSLPNNTLNESLPSAPVTTNRFEKPLKKNEDIALPKQNSARWIQIILAIFILMTIAFVVKMIDKYQKESEIENLPVTSPIESTSTTLDSKGNLSTPVSTTFPDGGMSQSPNSSTSSTMPPVTTTSILAVTASTSTTAKPTTTTTTTTTLKPTTTTTTLKVTTTTTLKAVLAPTTTTTVKSTTTTNTTTTTLSAKNIEVIVEALNTVQVKYILGDEGTKTMELKPDQVHTFKSRTKVFLDVSDGGAINVIVNGRDRGVPGTIGKSLKLTYP